MNDGERTEAELRGYKGVKVRTMIALSNALMDVIKQATRDLPDATIEAIVLETLDGIDAFHQTVTTGNLLAYAAQFKDKQHD